MLVVKQKYTQKTLETLKMHDKDAVNEMLSTATTLHKSGALAKFERIKVLEKLAKLIEHEQQDFAELIANEGGKPIKDARVEVTRAIGGIAIAISALQNISGKEIPMDLSAAGAGRQAFTVLEPIGVVVAVSAFNHPLNLAIHQVIPALTVGCPVIIKPAALTPLCTLRLCELIQQAGMPTGWVQVALTNRVNSEMLVTDARVAFFSFIGSAKVGWYLKSKLAPGTRCALEHGGVAPLIFESTKDEPAFIKGVVKASMYHSGQVCVSVQRIYVPKIGALDLAKKIASCAAQQIVGNAIDERSDLGPIISEREVDRIALWVNEAIEQGAVLLTGGRRINAVTFEPTVLFNPSKTCKVSTQEIFAPVVCVYSYNNIDEALSSANALDVSFQASVFSVDINNAINIAQRLEASAVMINDYTTFRVDWMPFAGRKHSGYGVGGIAYTMQDMLAHKMLVIKEN
jgi:acyl-CoA reductase-like NAD-dependent aldehyde dehydrogenase